MGITADDRRDHHGAVGPAHARSLFQEYRVARIGTPPNFHLGSSLSVSFSAGVAGGELLVTGDWDLAAKIESASQARRSTRQDLLSYGWSPPREGDEFSTNCHLFWSAFSRATLWQQAAAA